MDKGVVSACGIETAESNAAEVYLTTKKSLQLN